MNRSWSCFAEKNDTYAKKISPSDIAGGERGDIQIPHSKY